MMKHDTATEYRDIKHKISELQDRLITIKEEVSNYTIPFGKYKGKTLAEIASMNLSYYSWLKKNDLIPYTISPEMDIYIMLKCINKAECELSRQQAKMKYEQGYNGRYII